MKKHYSFLIAAAALLASCSNEELVQVAPAGDGNATFTISLNDKATSRAFGDGTTAMKLQYAVYEHGETTAVIEGTADFDAAVADGMETSVSLKLLNGKNYDIVFFAYDDNAATRFEYDADTQSISIDDLGAINNESLDAFYQVETTGTITGPISKDIFLYRPFAQLNLGTDDLNENEVIRIFGNDWAGLTTGAKLTAYKSLNLVTKELGDQVEVIYTPGVKPEGHTFPVVKDNADEAPYEYLSMNYILVPQEQSMITDVTFGVYENGTWLHDVAVTNVPLQCNYRTNVFGSLLTNPASYNVIKLPGFADTDYDVPVIQVLPEKFMETTFEAGKSYIISGTEEEPAEITVDAVKTIVAENIAIANATIDASYPLNIKANVTLDNVTVTGVQAGTQNPTVKIDDAETVTVTNCTFDRENSYNGLEIGLNSTTPVAEVNISGLTWENAKHNAISLYSFADNAVINITDCDFDNSLGGVPVRISNASYAKNVTINMKDVTRKSAVATSGRNDDVIFWIQDHTTYTKATKEGVLEDGNLFETLNPFGTFTINLENVSVDGVALTAETPVFTDKATGNTAKVAGVGVNSLGSKSTNPVLNVEEWITNQHVITSENAIMVVVDGAKWGIDLVTATELLPTVTVK